MKNKVIFVSIDGMRPDGFLQSKSEFVDFLLNNSAYTLSASSMNPSITLPCHLSMFLGVKPERHCTFLNTYVPPVHPVSNLFEVLKNHEKKNAMFYGWEPLRSVAPLGSMKYVTYYNAYEAESGDTLLTDRAISLIQDKKPDFVFLYLVETDEKGGHDSVWMSENYLKIVKTALDNVKRVYEKFGDEYDIIITADHGGHDRSHGSDMKEDMTIPMFFLSEDFKKGEIGKQLSLLDLAPTILQIFGIQKPIEWESDGILDLIKK